MALGDRLSDLVARSPGRVLAVVALLTLLALPATLRFRIDVDLLALLPAGSPVAEDYRRSLELFGGVEKIFVLVEVPPGDDEETDDPTTRVLGAVESLHEALADSELLAEVRSGLEPEEETFFFESVLPRALLLRDPAEVPDLARRVSPEGLRERARTIRATITGPTAAVEGRLLRADPLGFARELPLDTAAIGAPMDSLTGAFLAPDARHGLLVLTPASRELDPDAGHALLRAVDEARAALEDPGVSVRAIGGVLYAAHDQEIVRADTIRTATGSLGLSAALLLLAFGSWRPVFATVAALGLALAWAGAAVATTIGPVSAVGIAFAAVLVGLGVDYGIHGGARFRTERAAGREPADALVATWKECGAAIATSAATTAGAFGVLGLAHFRPLRELGLVVAAGMLAVLAASATAGSALLVATARRAPRASTGPLWGVLGSLPERSVDFAARRPRVTLAAGLLLTVLAATGLPGLSLEPDLRRLRPADHPAFEIEEKIVGAFGVGLDVATLAVPAPDLGAALRRSRDVAAVLRRAGGEGATVLAPGDWLSSGDEADARVASWRDAGLGAGVARFEAELRDAGMNPAGFEPGLFALRAIAEGRDPGLPPFEQWPSAMRELIRVDGETTWAAVQVRLPIGLWRAGLPEDVADEVERLAPGTTWAAIPTLGLELRDLALADVQTLGGVALLAVVAVVLVAFRGRGADAAAALLPVALGSFWTFGLWGLVDGRIDLLGLAVLPIMLGIGIDDGLHAVHGRAVHGSLAASLGAAGRAMTLTTATTGIGFASLVLSRVPGLRSGGLLVAVGVVACWVATLAVLPAFEAALRRGRVENSRRR